MRGSSKVSCDIAPNVGFTLMFWLVASSPQAKMCPERLPEPANAGPQAGGRRASLARSGRARDPTEWSRAQQVKLVVCRCCASKRSQGGLRDQFVGNE